MSENLKENLTRALGWANCGCAFPLVLMVIYLSCKIRRVGTQFKFIRTQLTFITIYSLTNITIGVVMVVPKTSGWLLAKENSGRNFYAVTATHDLITETCVTMVLFNLAYMHWTLSRQLKLAMDLRNDGQKDRERLRDSMEVRKVVAWVFRIVLVCSLIIYQVTLYLHVTGADNQNG